MRARIACALYHLELCGKVTQLGGVFVETRCSRSSAPTFTAATQRRCNITASAKEGKEIITASKGATISGAHQHILFGTMRSLHVGLVTIVSGCSIVPYCLVLIPIFIQGCHLRRAAKQRRQERGRRSRNTIPSGSLLTCFSSTMTMRLPGRLSLAGA